jgi:plastocyanin
MSNTTLIATLAAIVIIGGAFWIYSTNTDTLVPEPTAEMGNSGIGEETGPQGDTLPNEESADGGGIEAGVDVSVGSSPMSAGILLTSSGFSPKTVTIKKGGTVTWSNESSGDMWVASAQHPTHTVYDGTSLQEHCGSGAGAFDQCNNGESYSFIFNKVGTWNYHNHNNSSQTGTVVVVE